MMSAQAQREIAEMRPCAFCLWHTHDFPDDAKHEQMHQAGWHTCGLDGSFRRFGTDCKDFVPAGGESSY